MGIVDTIHKNIDFSSEESARNALDEMKSVPAFDLMYFAVLGETYNSPSLQMKQKIALCLAEKERRDADRQERLVKRTTTTSTVIGAVATIVGSALGAIATIFVFWMSSPTSGVSEVDVSIGTEQQQATPKSN